MSRIEPVETDEVEIEDRVPLTAAQRRHLLAEQNHLCGCGCGASLQIVIDGQTMLASMIDEHVIPLWCGGSNDLGNRSMWAVECSAAKTRREARERGKVNRIRRRLSGRERPKHKIRSRGFDRDPLRSYDR